MTPNLQPIGEQKLQRAQIGLSETNSTRKTEDHTLNLHNLRPHKERQQPLGAVATKLLVLYKLTSGPFQRAPATIERQPKPNPFGAAAPRDELAIQKQIEDRRLAKEVELKAREDISVKAKQSKDEIAKAAPVEKAPSGPGSWRAKSNSAVKAVIKPVVKKSVKSDEQGPANPTPAEEAKFTTFGKEKSRSVTQNAFEALEEA